MKNNEKDNEKSKIGLFTDINTDNQFDIVKELFGTISRNMKIISIVFIFVVLGVYGSLQLISERYNSHASILVKLSPKGGAFTNGVRKEEINSEIELIRSRSLIEQTIDKLGIDTFKSKQKKPETMLQSIKFHVKSGVRWAKTKFEVALIKLNLKKELSDREKTILFVEKTLSVERVKNSDTINVYVWMPSKTLPPLILNTLLKLYFDKHLKIRQDIVVKDFFAARLDFYKDRLDTIDASIDKIKDELDITSVDEQRIELLKQLHKLKSLTNASVREKIKLNRQKAVMTKRLSNSTLRKQFIKDIEQLRVTIAGLYAVGNEQQAQTEALEKELMLLNKGEKLLDLLEREKKVALENYYTYEKRLEESMISEELDQRRVSNIVIANPPSKPIQAFYPKKGFLLGLSFPFGLLLGLGIALFREYLDDTINSYKDLKELGDIPFLGTLQVPY